MSSQENSNKLLNRLLESVKECQKRYGGKTELATEFDTCVACLCNTLEAVFLHGLRLKPLEKPVKNISGVKQVSDIVEIVANSLSLNNEHLSFWPFVKKHLTHHDRERYDALKHIWTDTGRGKAWIRSTLNERSLERYVHIIIANRKLLATYYEPWALLSDDENNNLLPNMAAGLGSILFAISIDKPEFNSSSPPKPEKSKVEPIIEAPIIDNLQKDKKKRKTATIISFDDEDADPTVINQQKTKNPLDQSAHLPKNNAEMDEDKRSTYSDTPSTSSSSTDNAPPTPSSSHAHSINSHASTNQIVRKLSIETSGSRDKYPTTKLEGTLTPLEPHIGELTPISVEHIADDGITHLKHAQDGAYADIEVPTDVSALLGVVEAKNLEISTKLNERVALLTKENENLKEQLKNYMDAVKTLNDSQNGGGDDPDYKSEAKLFERKLVQVAEMHAELMDFNVVLQQALLQKENLVEKLKNELAELRGPGADDATQDGGGCVNVWIPSAFLTGSGSEAHHVYQIFLRAGTDEWNIYRRYAQFHALHSDLKKLDAAVRGFDFPPKKSLGNKDSSIVEDRRKRLQTYLRRILAHWPELSQCNSRFLLEQHLEFFKEQKDPKKRGLFSSRRSTPSVPTTESHYTGL